MVPMACGSFMTNNKRAQNQKYVASIRVRDPTTFCGTHGIPHKSQRRATTTNTYIILRRTTYGLRLTVYGLRLTAYCLRLTAYIRPCAPALRAAATRPPPGSPPGHQTARKTCLVAARPCKTMGPHERGPPHKARNPRQSGTCGTPARRQRWRPVRRGRWCERFACGRET